MRKKILLLLWILIRIQNLLSQHDSVVVHLDTAYIKDEWLLWRRQITEPVLNNLPTGSLNTLLEKSPSTIKTYGIGGASTLVLQGGNSQQTHFLWEGISMQSPLTGVFDMSNVSAALFENMQVIGGDKTLMYTSGSSSGSLQLSSLWEDQSSTLKLCYETSNNYRMSIKNSSIMKGITLRHTILLESENNQFNYLNYLNEINKLLPCKNKKEALLQDIIWVNKPRWQLQSKAWINHYQRNIPNNYYLQEHYRSSQQDDFWANGMLILKQQTHQQFRQLKAAIIHQKLGYEDVFLNISSKHSFSGIYLDYFQTNEISPNVQTQIGIQYNNNRSSSDAFIENKIFNRLTPYGSIEFKKGSYTLKMIGRYEKNFLSAWSSPILYSFILQNNLGKLKTFLTYAKNYRQPSLNDLYWSPGGNPLLLPEISNKTEAGVLFSNAHFHLKSVLYYGMVQNWIQWIPKGAYWGPENIYKVQLIGAENSLEFKKTIHEWHGSLKIQNSIQISKNKTPTLIQSNVYNKQLILIPLVQNAQILTLSYKSMRLQVSSLLSGKRFTSSDNKSFLEAYHKIDLHISKVWNPLFTSAISVENMTQTNYQLSPGYPMPLRYYTFTLLLNLKHSKNEKN